MATFEANDHRFRLVTAGFHFLLHVVPFREPESRQALRAFADIAARSHLPFAELDAVLLRCLAVLNRHTGGRLPSLVDRYISKSEAGESGIARFLLCVEDVLTYMGVGDGLVQDAIHILNTRLSNPSLTPRSIAEAMGVRTSTLCVAFKRQTGVTVAEYTRRVRLDTAANLLVTTNRSIKEIWASTGYNHPSNFSHDFKARFHLTPREYRRRGIRPATRTHTQTTDLKRHPLHTRAGQSTAPRILLVDDDEATCTMLSRYLRLEGYSVSVALKGGEGISEAERFQPNVLLLDYHLGDMDGIEVLRLLRRRFGVDRPAVAFLSADLNLLDRVSEIAALNSIVVSKLCDLDEIGRLIAYLSAPGRVDRQASGTERPQPSSTLIGREPH